VISFVILVGLMFGLYFVTDWFSKVTGYILGEDERERLANCLDESGAEFYSVWKCRDCENQIEIFGKSFDLIYEVGCGVEGEKCANVREFPAWYINGEVYYGLKEIDELKELSGCD
tara:strand:- start:9086 stop:9433 length:348 start_codon:yes stop_codon:yes gene_type:complete